ncbi:hypothetical protein [Pseudoalteromonas sp. S558]|uniref:hypothetical protein n=1 Tax=Pseudoalteromonas sp. S558 TaxID=2066515 RepID=UPI00110AF090|nr:hypothetical protein [Pseudoalteromonas sp. S558]TMN98983.1 hypothetical protein CWB66_16200 [Pseudoalteromonas sp. S558]
MYITNLLTFFSTCAAATSAYFSYKAIKASKKNIFLKDKNKLAITINDLYYSFGREFYNFKISEYKDERRIISESKFYVSSNLYDNFLKVLNALDDFEAIEMTREQRDAEAVRLKNMIRDISCRFRLDE